MGRCKVLMLPDRHCNERPIKTVEDFGMDGALLQRAHYQANALHGPSLRYWPNGQVMERVDFERGLMQGAASQFDQSGKALGAPSPTLVKRVEQLLRGEP